MATGQKRPRDPSLTFGSACSGLCAELFAAQILKLDVTPKFACDCDNAATKLSNSLWKHEQYFDNVWDPDFLAKAPQVDVFTAGFPCQPFSVQGLHGGVNDEKNGGAVVFQILRYIKLKKPKLFLLEKREGFGYAAPRSPKRDREVSARFDQEQTEGLHRPFCNLECPELWITPEPRKDPDRGHAE